MEVKILPPILRYSNMNFETLVTVLDKRAKTINEVGIVTQSHVTGEKV